MEELKNYQVTFKPVFLMAISPECAEADAKDLIDAGEIEIKSVYEI